MLALASPAAADDGAPRGHEASAEALFIDARSLMDAGRFDEACPKLAESQRLDPAIGTLLNLGECYERTARLASAWAVFREAEATAQRLGDAARAGYARERAGVLDPRLARLVIRVSSASDAPGLVVRHDGKEVGRGAWGAALPVDEGVHRVDARAPGRAPWRVDVAIGSGPARRELDIPPLTRLPEVGATPVPHRSPLSTAGWVGVGVGAAATVAGLAFGTVAWSKNREALDRFCDATSCREPRGTELTDQSLRFATMATVSVAVGATIAAAGVTLLLIAPRGAATSAQLHAGPSGLALGGRF